MSSLKKLREELEQLKAEILSKRSGLGDADKAAATVGKASSKLHDTLEDQIKELNRLVKAMLDDAETTVSEHPVATVAGALALGIAIGRVTAR